MESAEEAATPPRRAMVRTPGEVDWYSLDKTKFAANGVGLFAGVSTLLHPLSVVKTRLQTLEKGSMLSSVRTLAQQEGLRGLYRGYTTVLFGTLPVRVVYLSVLESTKANLRAWQPPAGWEVHPSVHTGCADFVAGASASLVSQVVLVPVDVIAQRLMVQGSAASGEVLYKNGWAAARGILAQDGVAGLYRGASASLVIYSVSSGAWWGAYGICQRAAWQLLARLEGVEHSAEAPAPARVVPVQISAAVMAGAMSGVATTPLDVVKTRLQTYRCSPGETPPSFRSIALRLWRDEGAAGFMRGMPARVTSSILWGTTMVQVFEFLKRRSARDEAPLLS